jgi:inorganic pyrophosphatase
MDEDRRGQDFWRALDEVLSAKRIVIDRPRGTTHPRYPSFRYPLDYGYVQGIPAPDGNELDVWKGSALEAKVTGLLCTADRDKGDVELKLLVSCTPSEMATARAAQDEGRMRALLVIRPPRPGPPFTIRAITPTEPDLQAVVDLYSRCEDFLRKGRAYASIRAAVLADLELSRAEHGCYRLIFDGEQRLLGVVDYVPAKVGPDGPALYIELLMIAPAHRGKGLGAAVVAEVENSAARLHGARRAELSVQIGNPAGLRFWQRQGYEIDSGPHQNDDGTIVYQLRKSLSPVG